MGLVRVTGFIGFIGFVGLIRSAGRRGCRLAASAAWKAMLQRRLCLRAWSPFHSTQAYDRRHRPGFRRKIGTRYPQQKEHVQPLSKNGNEKGRLRIELRCFMRGSGDKVLCLLVADKARVSTAGLGNGTGELGESALLPAGCLLGPSWVPPGFLLGASWVPAGCLMGVSWPPPACLLDASR